MRGNVDEYEMFCAVTPNDEGIMAEDDSVSIQNAVDRAHESGVNKVIIPRINGRTGEAVWNVGKAIILPSDMEVVLDNCLLKQKPDCFDNVFRNFADVSQGHTPQEQKEHIHIVGRGNAVIDGGLPNGLTEETSLKDGFPHISCNSPILFYNLRHFTLKDFAIVNQRWWGINLIHAEMGQISGLRIEAQCDRPNQDGIDLRVGCHDILLENLTGQAGDDFIALSAIGTEKPTSISNMYTVHGKSEDIHDIIIRNVIATSVECGVIALRNCDGRKIYNITIDNVHETDNAAVEQGKLFPDYPTYQIPQFDICRTKRGNTPYVLLRIGQYGYYRDRNARSGEVYGIHATNLYARQTCAVMINVILENSYFGNIYAENEVDYVVTTKSGRSNQRAGAHLKNVVFENVFYKNETNTFGTAFDFDSNAEVKSIPDTWTQNVDADVDYETTLEQVIVRNAFLGSCKHPFHIKGKGEVIRQNVFVE